MAEPSSDQGLLLLPPWSTSQKGAAMLDPCGRLRFSPHTPLQPVGLALGKCRWARLRVEPGACRLSS